MLLCHAIRKANARYILPFILTSCYSSMEGDFDIAALKCLWYILSLCDIYFAPQVALQSAVREDPELHDCVLLEVQRMWPPFVGGRRLVRKVGVKRQQHLSQFKSHQPINCITNI